MSVVIDRAPPVAISSGRISIPAFSFAISTAPKVDRQSKNDAEIAQRVRRQCGVMAMGLLASFAADEGIQEISALFGNGVLQEIEKVQLHRTSQLIDNVSSDVQAERAKERLMLHLRDNEFEPVSYRMEDHSTVVEFLSHPSRMVCVFDEDCLQILWRDKDGPHSEVVKNNRLDFDKVSSKIALILHSTDRRREYRERQVSHQAYMY